MHDFINGFVNLEKSRVDQSCITDTTDDRHFCSADKMRVKTSVRNKIFNAGYIFFCSIWL